jgi:hypothetical protein
MFKVSSIESLGRDDPMSAESDDFYAYTETLNAKRRAAKAATESQEDEFGSRERPEVVKIKKTDNLKTVDPARIEGGEVSR